MSDVGLPLQPGELVLGKYRVLSVLGSGGMGVVLAAQHVTLDQKVALKVLRPEAAKRPEIVERFLREGRAACRLESDHVAKVYDVDSLASGAPVLVMEFLDGRDLTYVRARGEALPVSEAVGIVRQTCAAVAEAHQKGIVHRDLKTANLFMSKRGDGTTRLKVLDFGISKIDDGEHAPGPTRDGTMLGSPEYMSPEQMVSTKHVDTRTDVWALGVVLYELLSARVPFPGESIPVVCNRVLSGSPIPLRSFAPLVPEELAAIVHRCLSKERDDRFPTVQALSDALAPFASFAEDLTSAARTLDDHPPQAVAGASAAISASAPGTRTTTTGLTTQPARASSKRTGGVALAVALVGLGGVGLYMKPWAKGGEPAHGASSPAVVVSARTEVSARALEALEVLPAPTAQGHAPTEGHGAASASATTSPQARLPAAPSPSTSTSTTTTKPTTSAPSKPPVAAAAGAHTATPTPAPAKTVEGRPSID